VRSLPGAHGDDSRAKPVYGGRAEPDLAAIAFVDLDRGSEPLTTASLIHAAGLVAGASCTLGSI
jgi:hypothetical protein